MCGLDLMRLAVLRLQLKPQPLCRAASHGSGCHGPSVERLATMTNLIEFTVIGSGKPWYAERVAR
jgi:hypothetical protein